MSDRPFIPTNFEELSSLLRSVKGRGDFVLHLPTRQAAHYETPITVVLDEPMLAATCKTVFALRTLDLEYAETRANSGAAADDNGPVTLALSRRAGGSADQLALQWRRSSGATTPAIQVTVLLSEIGHHFDAGVMHYSPRATADGNYARDRG